MNFSFLLNNFEFTDLIFLVRLWCAGCVSSEYFCSKAVIVLYSGEFRWRSILLKGRYPTHTWHKKVAWAQASTNGMSTASTCRLNYVSVVKSLSQLHWGMGTPLSSHLCQTVIVSIGVEAAPKISTYL